MSSTGRLIGLVVSAIMFAFSAWMYLQTGDWVAAIFTVGAGAYGFFFLTRTVTDSGAD
ncbi:MAG: hypothetical protein AAGI11_17685 [Pseudomonadota bacterium]